MTTARKLALLVLSAVLGIIVLTTWFLVSLLTELIVVLLLRTRMPAWRSRPSGSGRSLNGAPLRKAPGLRSISAM